jgi:hypothetical protein
MATGRDMWLSRCEGMRRRDYYYSEYSRLWLAHVVWDGEEARQASSCAATPSSRPSCPSWARSWAPIGRPSGVRPAGTLIAGQPVTFQGKA